ncbi:hypothetical protein [Nannocystis exedens]|uniref:hypothetical protein n=1 Tax=Nannocystis exedens TaxID=54 RepID=UPI0014757481|nr:hypothetical protein [Nannocystis exedens]
MTPVQYHSLGVDRRRVGARPGRHQPQVFEAEVRRQSFVSLPQGSKFGTNCLQ